MNNPCSISDDLFNVALKMAMEQKQQQTKSHKPENPFNIDLAAAAKRSASIAKQLYDAYVEAGFNEVQAFELVKGILTAKKN